MKKLSLYFNKKSASKKENMFDTVTYILNETFEDLGGYPYSHKISKGQAGYFTGQFKNGPFIRINIDMRLSDIGIVNLLIEDRKSRKGIFKDKVGFVEVFNKYASSQNIIVSKISEYEAEEVIPENKKDQKDEKRQAKKSIQNKPKQHKAA